jgi:hypothetical protein
LELQRDKSAGAVTGGLGVGLESVVIISSMHPYFIALKIAQKMKNRHISTRTTLEPYGLVRISGTVARNPFYTFEERQFEPLYDIQNLRVEIKNEVLHSPTCCQFEQWEIEKCEEVLIEKFVENEGFEQDSLIDEMIERGRELAHRAYE